MKTQINIQETPQLDTPFDSGQVHVQGHIKIFDPDTKEIFIDKRNAIHYENFSLALAQSFSNQGYGIITDMVFGNGGTRIDQTGIITYLTPNVIGATASLYNQTYIKQVNASTGNSRNFMETRHVAGKYYTDILVSCLLDFNEPQGQQPFDNAVNSEGAYIFDELGLVTRTQAGTVSLLTHVIFHPVQKSLNRMIQIDYTLRIQSLSGGV